MGTPTKNTTTKNTPKKKPRPARGSGPGRGARGDTRPSSGPPRSAHARRPDPAEVLGYGERSDVVSATYYADRFRLALDLALDEGAEGATIARSRAALMTWKSGRTLPQREAEEIRSRVFREWCEARGRVPLRGALTPGEPIEGDEITAPPIVVPRGRPSRDGEHPRRSGRR